MSATRFPLESNGGISPDGPRTVAGVAYTENERHHCFTTNSKMVQTGGPRATHFHHHRLVGLQFLS